MQKINLIMKRDVIVHNLVNKLKQKAKINLIYHTNYNSALKFIYNNPPNVVLIEVAESGVYDMAYCLKLCSKVRAKNLDCKILIMCSEQNRNNIDSVIEAKENKLIDDFVFYDVTIDYLVSKLISL